MDKKIEYSVESCKIDWHRFLPTQSLVLLNREAIDLPSQSQYLRLHFDERLTWRIYVIKMHQELLIRLRCIGLRLSPFIALYIEIFFYLTILQPV